MHHAAPKRPPSIQFTLPEHLQDVNDEPVKKLGRPKKKPKLKKPLGFKDLPDQRLVTPSGRLVVISKAASLVPLRYSRPAPTLQIKSSTSRQKTSYVNAAPTLQVKSSTSQQKTKYVNTVKKSKE
jgi:hypothetical protein